MVVDDLNFTGVSVSPCKANAPLIVDADAVFTSAIALQSFEVVTRQRGERLDIRRSIKHVQFAESRTLDSLEQAHGVATEKALCLGAAERLDHEQRIY